MVDPSQFPDKVRADLHESLRTRKINHKFHYDSYKQARKWLALHEAYSPARQDSDCEKIYHDCFNAAAKLANNYFQLNGLGCGGGQKDLSFLELLKRQGINGFYLPIDVSLPLVLTTCQLTGNAVTSLKPIVCDLAQSTDLAPHLHTHNCVSPFTHFNTFFGMVPNFDPEVIFPKLATLVHYDDLLLLSANLAPGSDYAAGVKAILPQYDNELTADWLMTFLLDLGVERADGRVSFSIEEADRGFRRVVAHFEFVNSRSIRIGDESFEFQKGERVRLFFSYRYQPQQVVQLLKESRFTVIDQWITASVEEGVFLCRKVNHG